MQCHYCLPGSCACSLTYNTITVSDGTGILPTLSNGSIGVDTGSGVRTDFGRLLEGMGVVGPNGEIGRCTACNKEGALAVKYDGIGITRNICKNCTTGLIDKLFGINIDLKTEKVLYGRK
jgi:hypothetical protein